MKHSFSRCFKPNTTVSITSYVNSDCFGNFTLYFVSTIISKMLLYIDVVMFFLSFCCCRVLCCFLFLFWLFCFYVFCGFFLCFVVVVVVLFCACL